MRCCRNHSLRSLSAKRGVSCKNGMNKIDYSKYSISELLQAKSSIDPVVAGENYNNLLFELENRKDEIEQYFRVKESSSILSTEKRIKVLGYFQLIGALVISLYLVIAISSGTNLVSIFVSIVAIALNGTAGFYTIKQTVFGYNLSFINLSLQLVVISTEAFRYSYNGLGGVFY